MRQPNRNQHSQDSSSENIVLEKSAKPHTCLRCLCRVVKWSLLLLFLLLCVLGGLLYYTIFTTDGACKAWEIAKPYMPDFIQIETTIEGGSVFKGLHLGPTKVVVEDIIDITADNLLLDYDLMQLEHKHFAVQRIESSNLVVSLNDKIFTTPSAPSTPSNNDFRLTTPISIGIDQFAVHGFDFKSMIVDVHIEDAQAQLEWSEDNIALNDSQWNVIHVNLKDTGDVGSADQSAMALNVNGKEVSIANVEDAVNTIAALSSDSGALASAASVDANAHNEEALNQQILRGVPDIEQSNGPVYTDPLAYAEAVERSLLDGEPMPTFVREQFHIHNPNPGVDEHIDPSYIEEQLLAQLAVLSPTHSKRLSKAAEFAQYAQDTYGVTPSENDVEYDPWMAMTGATAATLADEARELPSEKGQAVIDKAQQAAKPRAIVKDFGDGNGAIEPLPTIVLPFNAVVKDLRAADVRYTMEGFDTRSADIVIDAAWEGAKLQVHTLTVDHEFGVVSLSGDLNFDRYFDLDFVLAGEAYRNEETKTLFEGLLYGLDAQIEVQGNLTDLSLRSVLNLGGRSVLNARANVLSAALPMTLELKTRGIAYPIFGEPLVSLKQIDLNTLGNLVDGVDVKLNADVSGFDFKDVKTVLDAQISYEKSHISNFDVRGIYLGELLAAKVQGDVFYGKVMGVDAKVFAQVKDAGFVLPQLKGPLKLDADLVAVMNQSDQGKSAVAIASAPANLPHRIPKTMVTLSDFDADEVESKLLAGIKADLGTKVEVGAGVEASSLSSSSSSSLSSSSSSSSSAGGAGVKRGDEIPILSTMNGEEPIVVYGSLLGGVADRPDELALFSEEQYRLAQQYGETKLASQDPISKSVFDGSLPDVKANVRFIKAELFLNNKKTLVDIKDVVGDLQHGFRVDLLQILQGSNAIIADGSVTETGADLNAIIDIKELSDIEPSIKGSLVAQVRSSGNLKDLNFDLAGSSPKLDIGDTRLRKLVFNSSFNMQTRAINFTALADRIRIAKGMAANRQCFVDLSGTPLKHSFSANCGGLTSMFLSVDGSANFLSREYKAALQELYVSTASAGSLSLVHPVLLSYNMDSGVGEHSDIEFQGEIGLLSVSKAKFSPNDINSHITLTEFNLSSLSDFYPDSVKMQVPLNADALVVVKNGRPDIKVKVSSSKGIIYSTIGAGVPYEEMAFNARFTEQLMHSDFSFKWQNGKGTTDAVLEIHDPMGKARLSGYYKLNNFDLSTISNIGQSLNELKGTTNINLNFGGDLKTPLVFGEITSKGSAIPRYDVGQINDFDFALKLKGQSGDLNGKVVLNGQPLDINGNLDWSNGPNGSLHASAKMIPVFLVGYGLARANLDAQANLGEVLDVKGKVVIPSATISVRDVSASGASVSSDEILIGDQGTSVLMKKEPSNFKSRLDLAVEFGDKVNVSAMGMVTGRLAGGLNITKEVEDAVMKATGEIYLADGYADIYGKRFTFNSAKVNFYDDITNPILNVEVVADRDYIEDDVDVGVRVSGTAKAPDIKLFSKPMMSQNEILSYLLYGHGLDKGAIQQDSNNSSLLLGLGVSSMSGLASSLASSFGVRDIQFNAQGSGDSTQVSVEGYINRRLRISYGYGIFSSVGEFKVRYELINQLYAEFISAIDQAVDIVYSFEFD